MIWILTTRCLAVTDGCSNGECGRLSQSGWLWGALQYSLTYLLCCFAYAAVQVPIVLEVCMGRNFTARPGPVYIDWSRGFRSWQWPRRKLVVLAKWRRPMWSCGQPGTDVLL